ADGRAATRDSDRRGGAGEAAPHPDDHPVHALWTAAAGARARRGKRAPKTVGTCRDRRPDAFHANNSLRRPDAAGGDKGTRLQIDYAALGRRGKEGSGRWEGGGGMGDREERKSLSTYPFEWTSTQQWWMCYVTLRIRT